MHPFVIPISVTSKNWLGDLKKLMTSQIATSATNARAIRFTTLIRAA